MVNMQIKAMQDALEALEDLGMKHHENTGEVLYKETYDHLRQAIQEEALRNVQRLGQEIEQGHGSPEECDFCKGKFTEQNYPTPEEGGLWACIRCVTRWNNEMRVDQE